MKNVLNVEQQNELITRMEDVLTVICETKREIKGLLWIVDLLEYVVKHPEQRGWQALRNWSGQNFILKADFDSFNPNHWVGVEDTFYWEGKDE